MNGKIEHFYPEKRGKRVGRSAPKSRTVHIPILVFPMLGFERSKP